MLFHVKRFIDVKFKLNVTSKSNINNNKNKKERSIGFVTSVILAYIQQSSHCNFL